MHEILIDSTNQGIKMLFHTYLKIIKHTSCVRYTLFYCIVCADIKVAVLGVRGGQVVLPPQDRWTGRLEDGHSI